MKRKGNRHRTPPTEQQMWAMVAKARELTPPAFADYLENGVLHRHATRRAGCAGEVAGGV